LTVLKESEELASEVIIRRVAGMEIF